MSPTIYRQGPYRFFFWSHEPNEPPHVHVARDDQEAKFWLQPVGLAYNLGFSGPELRRLEAIVTERQQQFIEAWNAYFGT